MIAAGNNSRIAEIVRANRPRGVWTPAVEAPLYIANGWKLIDDGQGGDDVPLLPPAHFEKKPQCVHRVMGTLIPGTVVRCIRCDAPFLV